MNEVVFLLGSNLDNRIELLSMATELIIREIGEEKSSSSIYETEPWGFESSNPFLNQAILIKTVYSPEIVLEKALQIEKKLGRIRKEEGAYSDRSIDIDILLFNDLVIKSKTLEVPHPRMHQRRFCMEPLMEIVPDWVIPTFNKKVSDVYLSCEDNSKIEKINAKV